MGTMGRLDRAFFERPTERVAADLVGCTLMTNQGGCLTGGRIVETEAYGDTSDLASHAAIYQRSRSAIMSGSAGIAYVYRSYGVHACFNIIARPAGSTGAVLIRALEPVIGIEEMISRRGLNKRRLLCSGPGRLAQALAITLSDNGRDVVVDDTIRMSDSDQRANVFTTTRIGITRDQDRPWRFGDYDSVFLSRPNTERLTRHRSTRS